MKIDDIVKLLANKVNQPHVIEVYLKKIAKGSYDKGVKDTEEKLNAIPLDNVSGTELEEMKRLAHEGLPSECILDWDEIKFCSNRNREGNKCKECSRYK